MVCSSEETLPAIASNRSGSSSSSRARAVAVVVPSFARPSTSKTVPFRRDRQPGAGSSDEDRLRPVQPDVPLGTRQSRIEEMRLVFWSRGCVGNTTRLMSSGCTAAPKSVLNQSKRRFGPDLSAILREGARITSPPNYRTGILESGRCCSHRLDKRIYQLCRCSDLRLCACLSCATRSFNDLLHVVE
jgi:hypothetical protein